MQINLMINFIDSIIRSELNLLLFIIDLPNPVIMKGAGVAANVSSQGMHFSSVFVYIREHMDDPFTCMWLTKLLVKLLENGVGFSDFLSFVEDESDTPLHASVKFSLMAG